MPVALSLRRTLLRLAVLLLASFLSAHGASGSAKPTGVWCPARAPDPPLAEWLASGMEARVPPVHVQELGGTLAVDVRNATCRNVTVGHVAPAEGVGLRIQGVGVECAGDVDVHLLTGKVPGVVGIAVRDVAVDAALALDSAKSQLPRHLRVTACTVDVSLVNVTLTGTKIPKTVLPRLERLIDDEVKRYARTKLCDTLRPHIESAGDARLAALAGWLGRAANATALPPSPLPTPPPPPPRAPGTAWRANPLALALQAASDRADANGVLHRMVMSLTRGDGIWNVSSDSSILNFHRGVGERVNVSLTRAAIGGLDGDIGARVAPAFADGDDRQALFARVWIRTLTIEARLLIAATTNAKADGPLAGNSVLCEEVDLNVRFDHATLAAMVHVDADMNAFGNLMPNQYGCLGCVLDAVRNVSINELHLEHGVPTHVDVRPVFGGTARNADPSLEAQIDDVLVNWTSTVIAAYGNSAATALAAAVAAEGRLVLGAAMESELETSRNGTEPCIDPDQLDSYARPIGAEIALRVSFVLYIIAAMALLLWACQRIHKAWIARFIHASGGMTEALLDGANPVRSHVLPLSPGIAASCFVAAATAATFALFLSSNLSIAAQVRLAVSARAIDSYSSRAITVQTIGQPLYAFSLGNTVVEMWQAKVYVLAMLIFIMSGVWPYLKLLAVLLLWFLPSGFGTEEATVTEDGDTSPMETSLEWLLASPKTPGPSESRGDMRAPPRVKMAVALPWCVRRSQLLYGLDVLGKWSLTDIVIMVMLQTAFQYALVTGAPDPSAPNDEFSAMYVRVYPKLSLAQFALATVASLLLANFVVRVDKMWWRRAFGRRQGTCAREHALNALVPFHDRLTLLWDAARSAVVPVVTGVDPEDARANRRAHTLSAGALAVLLYVLALAYGLALVTPCMRFSFGGLGGFLSRQQQPPKDVRTYSIGTIIHGIYRQAVEQVPEESRHHKAATLAVLAVFVWATCAAPLLRILGYAAAMTRRAVKGRRGRVETTALAVARAVESWCACDVFLVSCIVAVAQLPQFVKFVLGHACDLVNPSLEAFGNMERNPHNPDYGPHDFLQDDDTCFDVRASLAVGVLYVFVAYAGGELGALAVGTFVDAIADGRGEVVGDGGLPADIAGDDDGSDFSSEDSDAVSSFPLDA